MLKIQTLVSDISLGTEEKMATRPSRRSMTPRQQKVRGALSGLFTNAFVAINILTLFKRQESPRNVRNYTQGRVLSQSFPFSEKRKMSQRRFVPRPAPTISVPEPSLSDDEVEDGIQSPSTSEAPQPEDSIEPEPPVEESPVAELPGVEPSSDADPIPTPVHAPEPVIEGSRIAKAIDSTKLAEYESLRITRSENGRMSYIVQLQSDASQSDREAHMQKVQDLCEKSEPKLAGIEAILETALVGYVGVFDDTVLREVWRDKPTIVHSIVQNQQAEIYGDTVTTTTMNWGASRISIDNTTPWSATPNDDNLWPYRKSNAEKEGDGTMLFLVDQGQFCPDDFQRPDHLLSTHPVINAETHSHATMMANVMAGETFGLAPQAKFWVFNALQKLSKVAVLLAFEIIAKIDMVTLDVKEGGGILCLPFGFPNTQRSNHPLATALKYLMEVKHLKVVTAAPNRHEYVTEYDSFPQNVEELILVGGSCQLNKLASSSDWSEKISIYAPAVEIPIRRPMPHIERMPLTSTNPHLKKGLGYGNCFGAAHVCGVMSLIMSADDEAPTQSEIKDALAGHFTNVTEYAGYNRVPIRVLKKFIQPHQPKRPTVSRPGSRAVSGAHRTGAGVISTLIIKQSSSGGFHVILAGSRDRVSKKISPAELTSFLDKFQPKGPDYEAIAEIFENDFLNRGRDIRGILSEITKVEVAFSWDVGYPSLLEHDTARERLRSVVLDAIQFVDDGSKDY